MKKILLVFSIVFLVFFLAACGKVEEKKNSFENEETKKIDNPIAGDEAGQNLFATTMDVSKEYLSLRLRTDNILLKASEYSDYETWNGDMTRLVADWQKFDESSAQLEKLAEDYSVEKVSFKFNFVETALAYDKQEISNVFDKAPAGQKIKTLAKFLGVDSKRAWQILQQDQNQVTADAWNEAGDTFQTLESSATVIKDGCKVTGFVGGVILTGGTAGFAASSALTQTAVVVSGADLVLDVTSDSANIAFGNNNKVSEIVGDIKKVTEPAAAILSIVTMPEKAVTTLDKLNVFVFGAEQLNSSAQEGKVIGISLPKYEKGKTSSEVGMVVIDRNDIENWLEENGYERTDGDVEEIFEAYDDEEDEETSDVSNMKNEEDSAKEVGDKEDITKLSEDNEIVSGGDVDPALVGTWTGKLRFTPSSDATEIVKDYKLELKSDGSVVSSNEGEEFYSWGKNGNNIFLYQTSDKQKGFYEFTVSGNNLNFVKIAGPDDDDNWSEVYAGEDFFGGKFMQINLSK